MSQTIVFYKDQKCFILYRCPYNIEQRRGMDPYNRYLFTGKLSCPVDEHHPQSNFSYGTLIFPRFEDRSYEEMCRFFHFDPEISKNGDVVHMDLMACYTGDGKLVLFKKGSQTPKRTEGMFKSRCKTVKEFCDRWVHKGSYHVKYWKFDKVAEYIVTGTRLDSMAQINPYLYESDHFYEMKWHPEETARMIDIAYNMEPVDLSASYDYTDEQKRVIEDYKKQCERNKLLGDLIDKGTTLYPEWFDSTEMFYDGRPYAYWCHGAGEWVLYKEYNDYTSVCSPHDCLAAVSYEEMLERFRTFCFYENEDREKLCRTFRQRSLAMLPEEAREWEDFIEE